MPSPVSDDHALISAGCLPQRLTVTTLGVADVATARAFYERLGFRAAGFDSGDVCFFDMSGTVLALYGRQPLADDAEVQAAGTGFRAVTCALNLDSEAAVDAALILAASAGATIVKQAERVFWGGYSGYFADPDGHLWEIAFNPIFKLDDQGRMVLPPVAPGTNK